MPDFGQNGEKLIFGLKQPYFCPKVLTFWDKYGIIYLQGNPEEDK